METRTAPERHGARMQLEPSTRRPPTAQPRRHPVRAEGERRVGASAARDADPEEVRRAYLRLLALQGSPPLLSDIVRELRGTYPAAVAATLRVLRLDFGRGDVTPATTTPYSVELHALDYEWYFHKKTVTALASRLPDAANVLFIGTPTVAAARARAGNYVRLIDSNPLVTRRFPDLAYSNTHIGRIEEVRRTYDEPDFIVLDAPWNASDVTTWLRIAHSHARTGTQIWATLFPAGTRPTAERERVRIIALAQTIGATTVLRDALRYETPLFEQEALRAQGVQDFGDWRTGDLLVIHVARTESSWDRLSRIVAARRAAPKERWTRFVVGTQVVKLRASATHRSRTVLKPVAGCLEGVLPSVSARDPRRKRIGIWTSRNRVASVGNPKLVAHALQALERGSTFTEALDATARKGTPLDDASAKTLYAVLDLPKL